MKTAVVINREIKFVDDSTMLIISIIVPSRNLQRMKDITGARIVGKELVKEGYRNRAGLLYRVVVRVNFSKIKGYLSKKGIHPEGSGLFSGSYAVTAESYKAYYSLLVHDQIYYNDTHILGDTVGLYAFGDCRYYGVPMTTTYYVNRFGKRIQLNNSARTDGGDRRYVKNNGQWFSNKKY